MFLTVVPDSEALIWWAWPAENEQTPCERLESGLQGAVSSNEKHKQWVSIFLGECPYYFCDYPYSRLQITFIATSNCSASGSIPKKRASSSTPGRQVRPCYWEALIFKLHLKQVMIRLVQETLTTVTWRPQLGYPLINPLTLNRSKISEHWSELTVYKQGSSNR